MDLRADAGFPFPEFVIVRGPSRGVFQLELQITKVNSLAYDDTLGKFFNYL